MIKPGSLVKLNCNDKYPPTEVIAVCKSNYGADEDSYYALITSKCELKSYNFALREEEINGWAQDLNVTMHPEINKFIGKMVTWIDWKQYMQDQSCLPASDIKKSCISCNRLNNKTTDLCWWCGDQVNG